MRTVRGAIGSMHGAMPEDEVVVGLATRLAWT
jgi:hypothetical protein